MITNKEHETWTDEDYVAFRTAVLDFLGVPSEDFVDSYENAAADIRENFPGEDVPSEHAYLVLCVEQFMEEIAGHQMSKLEKLVLSAMQEALAVFGVTVEDGKKLTLHGPGVDFTLEVGPDPDQEPSE